MISLDVPSPSTTVHFMNVLKLLSSSIPLLESKVVLEMVAKIIISKEMPAFFFTKAHLLLKNFWTDYPNVDNSDPHSRTKIELLDEMISQLEEMKHIVICESRGKKIIHMYGFSSALTALTDNIFDLWSMIII